MTQNTSSSTEGQKNTKLFCIPSLQKGKVKYILNTQQKRYVNVPHSQ